MGAACSIDLVRRWDQQEPFGATLLLVALSVVFVPLIVGCSTSPIDELLIHREARDIKKYSESNWRQISYSVELKYPATALTDATFARMKELGWSKCSGHREGWDSFVDASEA